MSEPVRCRWAVEHPELVPYHDEVWGKPTYDDREIFAAYGQCVLHAGLLWTAMLRKRAVFRNAFDGWDIDRVAAYDILDVERLMNTDGMIRSYVKIRCVIHNAGRIQEIQHEFGSLATYLWRFVGDEPLLQDQTDKVGRRVADLLAAELKRRGFKFSGPATAYGLMQDIGMVNDHDPHCFRAPHLA